MKNIQNIQASIDLHATTETANTSVVAATPTNETPTNVEPEPSVSKEVKETETETEPGPETKNRNETNTTAGNNTDSKVFLLPSYSFSYFANEKRVATVWLTFIALYWSIVMWIPTLISLDFDTPGFGMYCVGLFAIFAEGASIYGDKYPSGATKESPHGYSGRGRYSTLLLVICIIIDIVGLAFVALNRSTKVDEYFRAFCHFIALVWCSLFYYNRLLKENSQMAWTIFWQEWLNIVLTIVVELIIHNAYDNTHESAHNACFKNGLCMVYWVVFIIQLAGWMLPMMLIEGWGAEKHAVKVSLHLFVLDLCTNVPVLIGVVATYGYEITPVIFFDVMWKACTFIRSSAYFMVYYVWLRRGKKTHEPVVSKSIPAPVTTTKSTPAPVTTTKPTPGVKETKTTHVKRIF